MKNTMKKLIAALCAVAMMFALCACSSAPAESAAPAPAENEQKVYKVGICNYVDDASLNQIVDNIRAGLDGIGQAQGVTVYHAGTALKDGKLVTAGGRVLGVTALGADLQEALDKAYCAADKIDFENKHCRRDIGQRALKALK